MDEVPPLLELALFSRFDEVVLRQTDKKHETGREKISFKHRVIVPAFVESKMRRKFVKIN
jgi:hypothetical protein